LAQTFTTAARHYKVARVCCCFPVPPDYYYQDFVAFVVVDCGKEKPNSGGGMQAEHGHGGCRSVENRDPVLLTLFLGKGSSVDLDSMQQLHAAIDARVTPRIAQLLNEGKTLAA
jgi:hypothetical protein